MRITLTMHGGHTAGMRLPSRSVDVDRLDTGTADTLRSLVDAAIQSASTTPQERSRPVPDAMSYTITIEDGEKATTLKAADPLGVSPFVELLDYLEQLDPDR